MNEINIIQCGNRHHTSMKLHIKYTKPIDRGTSSYSKTKQNRNKIMNPKSIKIYWLNAIDIQPQALVIRIF